MGQPRVKPSITAWELVKAWDGSLPFPTAGDSIAWVDMARLEAKLHVYRLQLCINFSKLRTNDLKAGGYYVGKLR